MHRLLNMFSFTKRGGGNQEVAYHMPEPSLAASATTSDFELLPSSVPYPAPKRYKAVRGFSL